MPDSAAIGANFSTYTGDPALGGGTLGAIRIDTRPLEDLARYTFLYNKSEYDQRQKDAEKAAEEIADYMSYDLINGIPKFSKILQDKFDNLNKFIYDNNGEPINYRNRKLWTEYQRLRGDLGNDIAAAKLNEVIFMARKKAVEDEINPLEKQRKQKNLDKDISALNIRDRLKHDDQYDVTPVAVGTVPIIEIETTEIGRNIMGTATTKLPDMRLARNTAQGIAGGLLKISEQQGQFADQYEAAVASGKLEAVLSSQNFNAALQSYKSDPKYLNTDGTLNIDKIIAADNGIVSRNLRNIKVFNQNMREIRGQIANGYFKDKFNKELTFSNDASGLNESDYADININDGYSPDEIVLTRMFAQTPVTPPRKIKLDETDLAIKQQQLGIGWFNAKTGRIQEDRLAKAAGVSLDMATSAKSYAEALMNKLNSLKDAGGLISKDKLSKLTSDELKYLGKGTTTENKFTLTPLQLKGILTPLQIQEGITSSNDITSMIIDTDGTIKLYSGGTGKSLGTQKGESINVATIATNKLGDEMVTTAGKEGYNFNNLIPLYQSGNVQPTAQPQKTNLKVINGFEIPEGATVVYSKQTGKALGYTLNGKNYKF